MTVTTPAASTNGNAAVRAAVDKALAKPKRSKAKVTIALNADDLDLGDCIDLEDAVGQPVMLIFGAMEAGTLGARALVGLVWIAKRKADPTFTFEDAKRTKVTELETLMGNAGQAQG